MTKKYLKNQRLLQAKKIYKIIKSWRDDFLVLLRKQDNKSAFYEKKDDFVDDFLDDIKEDLPEYLGETLPNVMKQGAKANILKYKKILPRGYSLDFDLPTSPASNYIRELQDLHLSEKAGSTLKTTRDELKKIIADGLDNKLSYSQIADKIEEVDPFVFSKSRAKLIAVNEIGGAYGWADSEPARVLSSDYVMEKAWDSSGDAKVRETHKENEEQGWIPIDEPFKGTGDMYAPSDDINCRCTSTDRITGIKTSHGIVETVGLDVDTIKKLFYENRKERIM